MRTLPSPPLSFLFSNFLSLTFTSASPHTPSSASLPLVLDHYIHGFLCCASLSYFPFPSLKCPHSSTAFLLPPRTLIIPPQPIHLSHCYKRCTKPQTSQHQPLRQCRAPSFLPIQAVGRGRCRCSAPIFARPPCTPCTIFQTRPSRH